MSIAIQMKEEEFKSAMKSILSIQRTNVRFIFYIVKKQISNQRCSFVSLKNATIMYDTCFVYNELRNLAIETIQTSHYLLVDADGIVSCNHSFSIIYLATLENNLLNHIPLLSNEKEILLLVMFPYDSPSSKECYSSGLCDKAYNIEKNNEVDGGIFLKRNRNY